jgi:5-methylcytosine-specific restriction endonuclease McrA
VYLEEFRSSNQNYQRFYDNVRGGWSEKIINLRKNIIIKEFLKKFDIEEKDERRQITEEEKIACFAKNSSCKLCGLVFKDYKEPEYHHIKMHAQGGRTEIDNIMVLCEECHDKIHGNTAIEEPAEAEIEEEE